MALEHLQYSNIPSGSSHPGKRKWGVHLGEGPVDMFASGKGLLLSTAGLLTLTVRNGSWGNHGLD